jgi:hypothetical protein
MWDGRAWHIDLRRQDAAGSGERLQATLASYAGHLRHGATRRAWEDLWERYAWLVALFVRRSRALDARWSSRRLTRQRRFQAQYWGLVRRAGDDCLIFFQVGRFIEFYGPQRRVAVPTLGLHPVALPRARYAFTAGFPVWLAGVYLSRAVRQGLLVVQVRQGPALLRQGCIPRLPCAVWMPARRGRQRRQIGLRVAGAVRFQGMPHCLV